jgi:ABC-type nickel/cobalt efflux system permease component RcnA
MLIIGLVLILASAVVGVGAVYDGGESANVEVFGRTVDTTVGGVFLSGAATMLLLLIGVWMFTSSMGRARRKRAERKELKRRHRDSVARLEEERTQLRAENERLNEQLGQRPDATADDGDRTTTGQERVHGTGPATTEQTETTRTRVDGVPAEGAHARREADLREAERSSASRSRDDNV